MAPGRRLAIFMIMGIWMCTKSTSSSPVDKSRPERVKALMKEKVILRPSVGAILKSDREVFLPSGKFNLRFIIEVPPPINLDRVNGTLHVDRCVFQNVTHPRDPNVTLEVIERFSKICKFSAPYYKAILDLKLDLLDEISDLQSKVMHFSDPEVANLPQPPWAMEALTDPTLENPGPNKTSGSRYKRDVDSRIDQILTKLTKTREKLDLNEYMNLTFSHNQRSNRTRRGLGSFLGRIVASGLDLTTRSEYLSLRSATQYLSSKVTETQNQLFIFRDEMLGLVKINDERLEFLADAIANTAQQLLDFHHKVKAYARRIVHNLEVISFLQKLIFRLQMNLVRASVIQITDLQQYRNKLRTTLTSLKMLSYNKIDPSLVGPQLVKGILSNITHHLRISHSGHALRIYSTSQFYSLPCKTYLYQQNNLLVDLELQTMNPQSYHTLYELTLVPTQSQTKDPDDPISYTQIVSDVQYLAINSETYIPLNQKELFQCNYEPLFGLYTCDTSLMKESIRMADSCPLSLFLNDIDQIEKLCSVDFVINTNMKPKFIHLDKRTYIAILHHPMQAQISCDKIPSYHLKLHPNIIFQIPCSCELTLGSVIISSLLTQECIVENHSQELTFQYRVILNSLALRQFVAPQDKFLDGDTFLDANNESPLLPFTIEMDNITTALDSEQSLRFPFKRIVKEVQNSNKIKIDSNGNLQQTLGILQTFWKGTSGSYTLGTMAVLQMIFAGGLIFMCVKLKNPLLLLTQLTGSAKALPWEIPPTEEVNDFIEPEQTKSKHIILPYFALGCVVTMFLVISYYLCKGIFKYLWKLNISTRNMTTMVTDRASQPYCYLYLTIFSKEKAITLLMSKLNANSCNLALLAQNDWESVDVRDNWTLFPSFKLRWAAELFTIYPLQSFGLLNETIFYPFWQKSTMQTILASEDRQLLFTGSLYKSVQLPINIYRSLEEIQRCSYRQPTGHGLAHNLYPLIGDSQTDLAAGRPWPSAPEPTLYAEVRRKTPSMLEEDTLTYITSQSDEESDAENDSSASLFKKSKNEETISLGFNQPCGLNEPPGPTSGQSSHEPLKRIVGPRRPATLPSSIIPPTVSAESWRLTQSDTASHESIKGMYPKLHEITGDSSSLSLSNASAEKYTSFSC